MRYELPQVGVLADGLGRCREVEDHLRAVERQLRRGRCGGPEVLADLDAELRAVDFEREVGAEVGLLPRDGVTAAHVSLSSDAFGSQPKFDNKGECIGLTYASPKYLHKTVQSLVRRGLPLTEALKLLTTTPATILAKEGVKGCISSGADADLLVLDTDLNICSVFAKGKTAILDGTVSMKGRFED